jgi:serine protease
VVAAALAAQSSATAATPAATPAPGGQFHMVNLHSQFERAATEGHLKSSHPAGIVPALNGENTATRGTAYAGTKQASAAPADASAAACAEPNCPMTYNGGPVQHNPHVYLLPWGPKWSSTTAGETIGSYLQEFYYGLGQTSDSWSTTTSQYGDANGDPAFTGSVFPNYTTDTVNDTSTPPTNVTGDDLASEAGALVDSLSITDLPDAQVVVASQSGTCFDDGFAGDPASCTPSQNFEYCGWHSDAVSSTDSTVYVPFINLPWQADAGVGCGKGFVNGGTAPDGWPVVGGHEYSETITDPTLDAWFDPNDTDVTLMESGGEIADKCAWGGNPFGSDPFGNITLPIPGGGTHAFPMQSLWSNSANRCVMSTSPTLTVAIPATQKSTLGKAVSLQISATTNTGVQSYKASGLPSGLSINASTGKISGTPSVTAGTKTTTVTVSDYAKSATVSFSWQVSSVAGPVKGYASKCVDDTSSRTTAGNKIQIWTCTGGASQRITFAANGQLLVLSHCLTGGNVVFLEPCSAATNKLWTRQSNGEYVNKSNGKCLTDPSNSTTNGKQLVLAACKNAVGQRWSLP